MGEIMGDRTSSAATKIETCQVTMDTEVIYSEQALDDIENIERQLLQYQYNGPLYKRLVKILEALNKLSRRAHIYPIDTQNPKYRKCSVSGYVILYVWEENGSPEGPVARIARVIPSNWNRTNETRKLIPTEAATPGIRAYHGTVHDFAGFRIRAIGRGEGFQAFGYGLYFAENYKVAEYYADKLGEKLKSGDPHAKIIYEVNLAVRPDMLLDYDKRLTEQSDYVKQRLGDFLYREEPLLNGKSFWNTFSEVSPSLRVIAKNVFQDANGDLPAFERALHARVEHATDTAKQGADTIIAYVRAAERTFEPTVKPGQGQHLLDDLRNMLGSAKAASKWLDERGIPGVIYLDEGSRFLVDGQETHNIVMFSARRVRIVQKIQSSPSM